MWEAQALPTAPYSAAGFALLSALCPLPLRSGSVLQIPTAHCLLQCSNVSNDSDQPLPRAVWQWLKESHCPLPTAPYDAAM